MGKVQIRSDVICSFDVMHDLKCPPVPRRTVGGNVAVLIFPRWFGGTLSDARVAPGMKWKETAWSPWTRRALRCEGDVFG